MNLFGLGTMYQAELILYLALHSIKHGIYVLEFTTYPLITPTLVNEFDTTNGHRPRGAGVLMLLRGNPEMTPTSSTIYRP